MSSLSWPASPIPAPAPTPTPPPLPYAQPFVQHQFKAAGVKVTYEDGNEIHTPAEAVLQLMSNGTVTWQMLESYDGK